MKKYFFAIFLLVLVLFITGCGVNIQVEQKNDSIEVKSTNVIWRDFISLENSGDYKVSYDTSKVDLNKIGEYEVTYSFANKDGKKKTDKKFTFKVVDTTAPVLTLTKKSVDIIQGQQFDALSFVSVKDNYDALTKEDITVDNTVNSSTLGEYTVKYTVSDSSGNQAEENLTVNVIEEMTPAKLTEQLNKQPIFVTSAKFTVQHDQYKALYPDLLQAIIKNQSGVSIKNALVAFVAWDKNNLPVKIESNGVNSNTAYVQEVNYSDINLVNGDSFGKNNGFEIEENSGIKKVCAIVVSYEGFNGEEWENPLYESWLELYEGKQYIW